MNDHKICFIACVNNDKYDEEMFRYIDRLKIPEGYDLEYISVRDAKSMCAGYNEGMNSSDAKYKIYLHQDTFIINRNILYDILTIFGDPNIGMIGLVGSPKLPEDGVMWHGPRVGKVYKSSCYSTHINEPDPQIFAGGLDHNFNNKMQNDNQEKFYQEVEAIDGFFMATQVDVPWREDIFTHFDFYDISQSEEIRKAGFKVVVPSQEKPFCMHDDGFLNFSFYEEERKRFIFEYKGESEYKSQNHEKIDRVELKRKVDEINALLSTNEKEVYDQNTYDKKAYDKIVEYISDSSWFEPVKETNEFAVLSFATSVYQEEKTNLSETIFDQCNNIEELSDLIFDLRMSLFRIAFDTPIYKGAEENVDEYGFLDIYNRLSSITPLFKGLSDLSPYPKLVAYRIYQIFERYGYVEESFKILFFMNIKWSGNTFIYLNLASKISESSPETAAEFLKMIPESFWKLPIEEQSKLLDCCMNDWLNN